MTLRRKLSSPILPAELVELAPRLWDALGVVVAWGDAVVEESARDSYAEQMRTMIRRTRRASVDGTCSVQVEEVRESPAWGDDSRESSAELGGLPGGVELRLAGGQELSRVHAAGPRDDLTAVVAAPERLVVARPPEQ